MLCWRLIDGVAADRRCGVRLRVQVVVREVSPVGISIYFYKYRCATGYLAGVCVYLCRYTSDYDQNPEETRRAVFCLYPFVAGGYRFYGGWFCPPGAFDLSNFVNIVVFFGFCGRGFASCRGTEIGMAFPDDDRLDPGYDVHRR